LDVCAAAAARTKLRYALGVFASSLCAVILVAAVSSRPLLIHPSSRLLGDTSSDAAGVARGLWVNDQQHVNPFTQTRDSYTDAPEGIPVARAINAVQPVQPASIWFLSTLLGRIGAINAFLLVAFATTMTAMFLVGRKVLQLSIAASSAMAFAVSFNPWIVEHTLAGHLVFAAIWPLIALPWAFSRVAKTKTIGAAIVVGGAYGFSFLSAAYLGMIATPIAIIGGTIVFLRFKGWPDRLWFTTLVSAALITAFAMLLPGLIEYARDRPATSRIASHGVTVGEASGVSLTAYLNPGPHLAALGNLHVGSTSLAFGAVENIVFFGYSILGLGLAAMFLWFRGTLRTRNPDASFILTLCAYLAPIGVLLSLAPHMQVFGHSLSLPSALLEHVTSYYRVYSRFAIAAAIAFVIFAGIALNAIEARWRAAGWLLAALVVAELWPAALPTWNTASRPVDRWLASQPAGIVAEYPQITDQSPAVKLALTSLAYQPNSGHPLYTLMSGGTGGTREAGIRILSRYLNDPITPSILAAEHVRYVVVNDDVYKEQGTTAPPIPPELRYLARVDDARFYELRATSPAADLNALLTQNAASIALVQGLGTPDVTYGRGFSKPTADGWRAIAGRGEITLDVKDPNLNRTQLILTLRATAGRRTLSVEDTNGAVIGKFNVGAASSQVTAGPFGVHLGTNRVVLRGEGMSASDGDILVAPIQVQPLADFTTSLQDPG
jgi:hypothetical protein